MIVVTGSNGFIGSAFLWQLNQAGHKNIICVDSVERFAYLKNKSYSKFLLADELWDWLNSNTGRVTWVIHFGACSSTTETNRTFLYQNNVMYSVRLWQWCKRNSAHFVYASSAATYGAGELGFSDAIDSEQLKPLNPYGESKVLFDRWALKQVSTPSCWYGLKFFNVYGPNEDHKGFQASVPHKAFSEISQTQRLKLFRSHRRAWRDGKQMRDFIYVKDVTRWILEIMEMRPTSGIYNMGFGTARSWLDLSQNCFSSLNRPSRIDWIDIPENIRENYQYYTEADISRLITAGLSEPQWPLEKGIKDFYQNYLLPQSIL